MQLLDGVEVAGLQIDLAVGVAVNLGVKAASVAIFFAVAGALSCIWHNHLAQDRSMVAAVRVAGWGSTAVASAFFAIALLTVPLTLPVEAGVVGPV